jgi:hypothetical protein
METKPPPFALNTSEWWVKPLAMLQHNWAVIDIGSDLVTVYFFHDDGTTKNYSGFVFRSKDSEKYIAIVDSLSFSSHSQAHAALAENGFRKVEKVDDFYAPRQPMGIVFDARHSEPGIYSKQGYWLTQIDT